jgi:hypothetical protein
MTTEIPYYTTETTIPQRDPRTTISRKQLYVYVMFGVVLFCIMTAVGVFIIFKNCPCTNNADTGFYWFNIFFCVIIGVALIVDILAMIYPNFMWRTKRVKTECLGIDEMDCDPIAMQKLAAHFDIQAAKPIGF